MLYGWTGECRRRTALRPAIQEIRGSRRTYGLSRLAVADETTQTAMPPSASMPKHVLIFIIYVVSPRS